MTGECELHDVEFDKCSVCPVCEAVYFERERIIQVLLNNTSEINLMLNGEIIRLDAWDKTPKFAEQTLRQLFEGENK